MIANIFPRLLGVSTRAYSPLQTTTQINKSEGDKIIDRWPRYVVGRRDETCHQTQKNEFQLKKKTIVCFLSHWQTTHLPERKNAPVFFVLGKMTHTHTHRDRNVRWSNRANKCHLGGGGVW